VKWLMMMRVTREGGASHEQDSTGAEDNLSGWRSDHPHRREQRTLHALAYAFLLSVWRCLRGTPRFRIIILPLSFCLRLARTRGFQPRSRRSTLAIYNKLVCLLRVSHPFVRLKPILSLTGYTNPQQTRSRPRPPASQHYILALALARLVSSRQIRISFYQTCLPTGLACPATPSAATSSYCYCSSCKAPCH
jgi:hypothetical protein